MKPLPHDPTLAAVIVSFNRRKDVLKAIESIKAQSYPVSQIIVVDNDSRDGTVEALRTEHPDVEVIETGRNAGACGGRNIGTRQVTCDLVHYVDDDATLEPDALEEIVSIFRRFPNMGAVSSLILDPRQNIPFTKSPSLRCYPHPREGSLCVRMDLLPPDPWPENFFYYGEGMWVALEIYNRGYEVGLWLNSIAHHHVAPGGHRRSLLFFFARNSFLLYYQRFPLALMPPILAYKVLRSLIAARSPREVWDWARAMGDSLRLILMGKARRDPITIQAARKYLGAIRHQLEEIGAETDSVTTERGP
ncbi:MAG: glycosyltransferase [Candidatus Omnitrophica bacterium]|nr:glycosyltransferase [Candidatus Omnitrophota bacterium]